MSSSPLPLHTSLIIRRFFHGSPYFVFLTESALTDPTPYRCYVNKKKLFDNLALICYLFVVGKNTPPEVYPDQSDD